MRAHPGDGHILLLAATAALLDQDPARAQVFLKRFSKRYVAMRHLPPAARPGARAREQARIGARRVLEAHGLTECIQRPGRFFPAALTRRAWLLASLRPHFRTRQAWPAQARSLRRRGSEKAQEPVETEPRALPSQATRRDRAPAARSCRGAAAPPPLPLIDIDIPFSAELDLAPLLTAMQSAAGQRRRLVRLARALCPSRPRARLRRAALPAASARHRNLLVPGRDRAQGAQAVSRPGAACRRGRARQDHRGRHGAQGVSAARHGRAACSCSPRRRSSGSGGRSSRPSSTSPARPPTTRCCAATRTGSGTRSA